MLNNETIKFLKNINLITNSVNLEYPIAVGNTDAGDVAFKFDLSKLDTDGFNNSLGIYNLSSFLNMFNLFGSERETTVTDTLVSVKDENSTANYLLSDITILQPFCVIKREQIDKTLEVESVLELDLTVSDLKKIKNASSVFTDLDTVLLSCDENTTISLTNAGEFNQSSNSFKFTKSECSTKNFKISVGLDTIFKLPVLDYRLAVKYNASRDAYRIILTTENLTILLSATKR